MKKVLLIVLTLSFLLWGVTLAWAEPPSGAGRAPINADTLDGLDSTDFATSDHNHDTDYSPLIHNHDTDYSPISHDHDGQYSSINHNHDGNYANVVHTHSEYQQRYSNVAVVAVDGGDYTDPAVAMGDYTVWCTSKPCLLKIMPGVYDIGSNTLQMQEYVDIEGSGENVTKITGNIYSTVLGASNAEIRFLTVENSGSETFVSAIRNSSVTSLKMTHVTATASGGKYSYGVDNNSSSITMTDVTANSLGGGIFSTGVQNFDSSVTMMNVTASASGGSASNDGFYNSDSSVTMMNVIATGLGSSGSYSSVGVVNSHPASSTMTNVIATASGGSRFNRGVYNSESSPTMTNVIATASGGTDINRGVHNFDSSSPTMMHVTATASGGSSSYGVDNERSSSPTMTNVIASASGGTTKNYGVYNNNSYPMSSSSITMMNVTATASGGSDSIGVRNLHCSSGTMTNVTAVGENGTVTNQGMGNYALGPETNEIYIDRSTFEGDTNSIDNYPGLTLYIGSSKLAGGAADTDGTYHCVNSYNGDYSQLDTYCQ